MWWLTIYVNPSSISVAEEQIKFKTSLDCSMKSYLKKNSRWGRNSQHTGFIYIISTIYIIVCKYQINIHYVAYYIYLISSIWMLLTCMYVCELACGGIRSPGIWSYRAIVWGLGTELRSSARVTSGLNSWLISLPPYMYIFNFMFLLIDYFWAQSQGMEIETTRNMHKVRCINFCSKKNSIPEKLNRRELVEEY